MWTLSTLKHMQMHNNFEYFHVCNYVHLKRTLNMFSSSGSGWGMAHNVSDIKGILHMLTYLSSHCTR